MSEHLEDRRSAEHLAHLHEQVRARRPNLLQRLVKRIVRALFFCLGIRVYGMERLPAQGPVILASNHETHLDPLYLAYRTPRGVVFMAKSTLFSWWNERFFVRVGAFPVRRGAGDTQSLQTARTVIDRGDILCIFPQGGISKPGRVRDSAKKGVGILALQTGAAVVPAWIEGARRPGPWWRLGLPRVRVHVGEPITVAKADGATDAQAQAVADEVFAAICALGYTP